MDDDAKELLDLRKFKAEHEHIVAMWHERRCTGRTSRMLRDAVILALLGNRVVLVFPTDGCAQLATKWQMRQLVRELGAEQALDSISVASVRQFKSGRFVGVRARFLVDHSVYDRLVRSRDYNAALHLMEETIARCSIAA